MPHGGQQVRPIPSRDVRLRGFSDRASVDQATAWVDARARVLGPEEIGGADAVGRVLAAPIAATFDLPGADLAGVDGYALRASETIGASDYNPLVFAIQTTTESLSLRPATAALVHAGAALPLGADAILPFEAGQGSGATLEIFGAVAEGSGIQRKGQQLRTGSALLALGRVLQPQDVGLLTLLGVERVQVVRRPRVRLIVAGPKPVAGLPPLADANGPMLRALVTRDGGIADFVVVGADLRAAISGAIAEPGADVILVAGRTGTGLDDESPLALDEAGELAIHGIAVRPGESAGMGLAGGTPVFLLPGAPLACFCAYELFAGRLIRGLGGRGRELPYPIQEAEAGRKIVSAVGIVDLYRVHLVNGRVEPLGSPDSGGLASTVRADGFVLIPAPLEGYAPGAPVRVHLFK